MATQHVSRMECASTCASPEQEQCTQLNELGNCCCTRGLTQMQHMGALSHTQVGGDSKTEACKLEQTLVKA